MLRDPSLIPLSHDHQRGLALCVLTRRALADSSAENVLRLAGEVAAQFERELAPHFAIEEEVLFPVCGGMPIVAELLAEHRRIQGLVQALRGAASAALLEAFCELLSSHIRKEEQQLFEEIQRSLPPDVLEETGEEIRRREGARQCSLRP